MGRKRNATDKYKINPDSSSEEESDGEEESQDEKDKKRDKGVDEDEKLNLSVNYKDFNKVILKRKDILKWHDMKCFETHSKNLFAKVVSTHGRYVIGKIKVIYK